MEHIPGYDDWKTTPPDEPDPVKHCAYCRCELYEGDVVYAVDGEICEKCLERDYRRIL